MANGIHAPWGALWLSGLVTQATLVYTQYILHVEAAPWWSHVIVAGVQGVVGVAMVYGPRAAGTMARDVGRAIRIGKGSTSIGPTPSEDKTETPL